jgi:Ni2+-binding GTPase involved in regulation of expression and maturation of urease and hydrogenase
MCSTCGCAEGNLYIEGDEHRPHSAFRSAPFSPAARPASVITGITFAPQQSGAGDLHYGHGEAGTHGAAASLMLLNKVDLLPYLNFDVDKCLAYAREVNPDITILLVSATRGDGMDAWLNWLESERCA